MFLFGILILILILLFEGVATEIVAPVGFFGLIMVWVVGWRQGKQLYSQFYVEEMSKYQQELGMGVGGSREERKVE